MATQAEVLAAYAAADTKFKEFADDTANDMAKNRLVANLVGAGFTAKFQMHSKVELSMSFPVTNGPFEKQRWVKNSFFEGGSTLKPRLDELHNVRDGNVTTWHDSTDQELAEEIVMRVGISNDVKAGAIARLIVTGLRTVYDPDKFCNPNFDPKQFPKINSDGTTEVNENAVTNDDAATRGTTTEVVEEMSSNKADEKKTSKKTADK